MKINELVAAYVKCRDRKAAMKAAFDEKLAPLDAAMDKIEQKLLEHFSETGSESVRTEFGTAYRTTRTSFSVADWDTYMGWIMENPEERLVFIEARVSKKAAEEYVAANDDLIPGTNMSRQQVVNFRRS